MTGDRDQQQAHAILRAWLEATPAMDAQVRTTAAQHGLEGRIATALAERTRETDAARADADRLRERIAGLADDLLRVAQDRDGITATVYRQNADRLRAVLDETP